MTDTTEREQLREIASLLAGVFGRDVGFACFLGRGDGLASYLSNADRSDMIKALEEWLEKTAHVGRGPKEAPDRIDARLALERRCAGVGAEIAKVTEVALFAFDFGEGGNMAYFTNVPNLREAVERFVKTQRGWS